MAHSLRYELDHIPDFRSPGKIKYSISDVLLLVIYCIINGIDDYVNMEKFLNEREQRKKVRTYLQIKHIPSHDTFNRVLRHLNWENVSDALFGFLNQFFPKTDRIALDGKGILAAAEKRKGKRTPYLLNAYNPDTGLPLAHQPIPMKNNEITALPEIIERLGWLIHESLITIDAIGAQTKVIQAIRAKGGHYLIPIKGNQKNTMGTLEEFIDSFIDTNDKEKKERVKKAVQINRKHGRQEERTVYVLHLEENEIDMPEGFEETRTVAMMEKKCQRKEKGKTTFEQSYTVSDLILEPEDILKGKSSHWGIESGLHWTLDVVFNEDRQKTRKGHGMANCSAIRKFVYGLCRLFSLNQPESKKGGCTTESVLIHLRNNGDKIRQFLIRSHLEKEIFRI